MDVPMHAKEPAIMEFFLNEIERNEIIDCIMQNRYFVRNNYFDSNSSKEALRSGWDLITVQDYFQHGSPQFVRGMISEEPISNTSETTLRAKLPFADLRSFRLFAGRAGCLSDMHFDWLGAPLVHVLLHGSKKFIFLPPIAGKILEPSGNLAQLNVRSVRDEELQRIVQHYNGTILTLRAGQLLIQPPFWWHHVSYEENSIAVSAEFGRISQFVHNVLSDRRVPRDYRVATVLERAIKMGELSRLQAEECDRFFEHAARDGLDAIDCHLPLTDT